MVVHSGTPLATASNDETGVGKTSWNGDSGNFRCTNWLR